jgi:hypothetical protein
LPWRVRCASRIYSTAGKIMSEENEIQKQNDDEFETKTVTVERNGKTRTFVVRELPYPTFCKLQAALSQKDEAQGLQARERFGQNLIAASTTEDGNPITFAQVERFGSRIGKKLEAAILELNGMTETTKEDAKNA